MATIFVPQAVTTNHYARRMGAILSNGHKYVRIFPAHTNFVAQLREIYTKAQEPGAKPTVLQKRTVKILTDYLQQAYQHVPQVGQPPEHTELLTHLATLINAQGLLPVLQYLLRLEAASFDSL